MTKTRKVDVKITNPDGSIVFKKPGFVVPKDWSDTAATIAASKYANTDENSMLDIINRVVSAIAGFGIDQKYFKARSKELEEFETALTDILINQRAAFNSPVWFNAGVETNKRQFSACFILPIEDTMDAILKHTVVEGNIFKSGSGTGINISKLRAKGELLSNRGHASGPISFMKGWDAFAGVIKSGGKVRRAAKLVCLDADHPDIFEFIECKRIEENKAKLLIKAGIEPEEAYSTVAFQNTNHSIRVTDKFMETAKAEDKWNLINRGDARVKAVIADDILQRTAEVAWDIGDPGIQFHDRTNIDNPVPSLGEIRASNPCAEYCSVDYGACNLASLNLVKYLTPDSELDESKFAKDINILITAMDILVEAAEYPTPEIREMTIRTRPLGLGYTNLGAYLMIKGLAYDSEEAREEAAFITKTMTTEAYVASIQLARKLGSFSAIEKEVSANIARRLTEQESIAQAIIVDGMRNSQLTLLAPCGTISFLMNADSTGVEPLFALRSTKKLAGGGSLDLIPECVAEACSKLREEEGIDISPDKIESLDEKHRAIFKTANEIDWKDHILMMAACQRHLNGAISKTINMPNDCTIEDVKKAYRFAWKRGLKSLTIYRDGSKGLQPLSDATKVKDEEEVQEELQWTPVRRKLPDTRQSVTHKFNIGGFEGYITAGMYEDGTPGEVFINSQKQGNWANGMLDAFATILSMALQYGVPLESLKRKFVGTRFDPAGFTSNEDIRLCTSLMDYIFRWLGLEFLDEEDEAYDGPVIPSIIPQEPPKAIDASGPPCTNCGNPTMRSGTCFVCSSCGTQTGCG